jgi:hypothetical protein
MRIPYTPLRAGCLIAMLGLIPPSALAFDPAYMATFRQQITRQICADGGKWLSCYRLAPENCASVAQTYTHECAMEVFAPVKDTMDYQVGLAAAAKFQECFNRKFQAAYESHRIKSPECEQPPAHLQDKK